MVLVKIRSASAGRGAASAKLRCARTGWPLRWLTAQAGPTDRGKIRHARATF